MNLGSFKFVSVKLSTLLVVFFCFSCGEDFTNEYNKTKKEYEEILNDNKELSELNEKLKGENLELVLQSQNKVITNFITDIFNNLINIGESTKTTYNNIFKEGKLHQTTVKYFQNYYMQYGIKPTTPIETKVFTHSYDDKGLLIKSESEEDSIEWGWKDKNCISVIHKYNEYTKAYNFNVKGQVSEFEDNYREIEFTYNDDNLIIKRVEKPKNSDDLTVYEYTYNEDKALTRVTKTQNEKLKTQTTFDYGNNLFVYDTKTYKYNGDIDRHSIHTFNSDNRIIRYYNFEDASYDDEDIIEIEYTDDKISKYTMTEKKLQAGLAVQVYTTTFENITHYSTPKYLRNFSEYRISSKYFKKCKYTNTTFSVWGADSKTIKEFENIEERKDSEYHNALSVMEYNRDETKKEKITYSEWFTEYPFAPKRKETIKYTDDNIEETVVEINNNNTQRINWETQK